MPLGNRRGPAGVGPMTGRRAGYCAGFGSPGYTNPAVGFGFGGGQSWWCGGAGHGRRNMFRVTGLPGWMRFGRPAAAPPGQTETEFLKHRAECLRAQLEAVTQRLAELSGRAKAPEQAEGA
jgi:hypothetical protein